ncbi:MAG: hypothetical protein NTX88_00735 [Candidatus Atribacteria bacterium]|nr:hypothetical protein [Candidatus Atribacteria bacterium]
MDVLLQVNTHTITKVLYHGGSGVFFMTKQMERNGIFEGIGEKEGKKLNWYVRMKSKRGGTEDEEGLGKWIDHFVGPGDIFDSFRPGRDGTGWF